MALTSVNAIAVTGAFEAMWLEDMGADFKAGETSHPQFATKRTTLASLTERREAEASKLRGTDGEIEALVDDLNLDCVNFRQEVGIAKGKKSLEYRHVPQLPGGGKKKPGTTAGTGGQTS